VELRLPGEQRRYPLKVYSPSSRLPPDSVPLQVGSTDVSVSLLAHGQEIGICRMIVKGKYRACVDPLAELWKESQKKAIRPKHLKEKIPDLWEDFKGREEELKRTFIKRSEKIDQHLHQDGRKDKETLLEELRQLGEHVLRVCWAIAVAVETTVWYRDKVVTLEDARGVPLGFQVVDDPRVARRRGGGGRRTIAASTVLTVKEEVKTVFLNGAAGEVVGVMDFGPEFDTLGLSIRLGCVQCHPPGSRIRIQSQPEPQGKKDHAPAKGAQRPQTPTVKWREGTVISLDSSGRYVVRYDQEHLPVLVPDSRPHLVAQVFRYAPGQRLMVFIGEPENLGWVSARVEGCPDESGSRHRIQLEHPHEGRTNYDLNYCNHAPLFIELAQFEASRRRYSEDMSARHGWHVQFGGGGAVDILRLCMPVVDEQGQSAWPLLWLLCASSNHRHAGYHPSPCACVSGPPGSGKSLLASRMVRECAFRSKGDIIPVVLDFNELSHSKWTDLCQGEFPRCHGAEQALLRQAWFARRVLLIVDGWQPPLFSETLALLAKQGHRLLVLRRTGDGRASLPDCLFHKLQMVNLTEQQQDEVLKTSTAAPLLRSAWRSHFTDACRVPFVFSLLVRHCESNHLELPSIAEVYDCATRRELRLAAARRCGSSDWKKGVDVLFEQLQLVAVHCHMQRRSEFLLGPGELAFPEVQRALEARHLTCVTWTRSWENLVCQFVHFSFQEFLVGRWIARWVVGEATSEFSPVQVYAFLSDHFWVGAVAMAATWCPDIAVRAACVNRQASGRQHIEFLTAVSEGSLELVEAMILHGSDFSSDQVVSFGGFQAQGTPLWMAACFNHAEIVLLLRKHGACVEASGCLTQDQVQRRGTPVWIASALGHTETVQVLLESGCFVEARGNEVCPPHAGYGESTGVSTPLWIAVYHDHPLAVQALLKGSADPSAVCSEWDPNGLGGVFVGSLRGAGRTGTAIQVAEALRNEASLRVLRNWLALHDCRGCDESVPPQIRAPTAL